MTDLQRTACVPCQRDEHHQCRDGEWGGCPCPHQRGLVDPDLATATTDPSSPAVPPSAAREVGPVVGVAGGEVPAASQASLVPVGAVRPGRAGLPESMSRPAFYGERPCRFAGPGHECLTVHGGACLDELQQCARDDFERLRSVAS